jgi:hypothetical protein
VIRPTEKFVLLCHFYQRLPNFKKLDYCFIVVLKNTTEKPTSLKCCLLVHSPLAFNVVGVCPFFLSYFDLEGDLTLKAGHLMH